MSDLTCPTCGHVTLSRFCTDCKRPMQRGAGDMPEGTVRYNAHGRCMACNQNRRRRARGVKVRATTMPTTCTGCRVQLRPRSKPEQPGVVHAGHGKCPSCYARSRVTARNPNAKRVRRRVETLEEYDHLAGQGYSDQRITEILGLHPVSLKRVLATRVTSS